MPSETRLKRRLVRKASPSPANIRVGSSPSRLKANTPAVKGKEPGTFSFIRKRRLPFILEIGQRDLADLAAGERFAGELGADLLVADLHHVLVGGVQRLGGRPLLEQLLRCGVSSPSFQSMSSSKCSPGLPHSANSVWRPAATGARGQCGLLGGVRGSRAPSRRSRPGSGCARAGRSPGRPTMTDRHLRQLAGPGLEAEALQAGNIAW